MDKGTEELEDSPGGTEDELKSIPQLKELALASVRKPSGTSLTPALASIASSDTTTLMLRLQSAEDPLRAWALHVELDRRGVPPCLRPDAPYVSKQSVFIETLADLHWTAQRNPGHQTLRRSMRGVFEYHLRSDKWHRSTLWTFRQMRGKSHMLAKALGLTDAQRCETKSLPTDRQHHDRRKLRERMPEMMDAWVRHALDHPDKSSAHAPEHIARRRADLVAAFILLGRRQLPVVRFLKDTRGQQVTRQNLAKQLNKAAVIADAEKLVFGSLCRRSPTESGGVVRRGGKRRKSSFEGVAHTR